MIRYKLKIEYEGSDFVGWQKQNSGLAVQEVVEKAIEMYSQNPVSVQGAGRTDAGVHAFGQVAHVDIPRNDDEYTVRNAINAYLKDYSVVILDVEKVNSSFHARFGACERVYKYLISTRKVPLTLDRNRYWWLPRNINVDDMRYASQFLIGKHDFTSFRSSSCQSNSPIKTLNEIKVSEECNKIEFQIRAPSFLHNQVRNIVGSLTMVGIGKWKSDYIREVLDARDRAKAGVTAPACGLYLMSVKYSD